MTELCQRYSTVDVSCIQQRHLSSSRARQSAGNFFQSVHSEISTSFLIPWALCYIIFQDVVFFGTQDEPTRCVSRQLHIIYILWISTSLLSLSYNVLSLQPWHYFNWTKDKVKDKDRVSRFFEIDNWSRERSSHALPALIAGIYWAMQPREG